MTIMQNSFIVALVDTSVPQHCTKVASTYASMPKPLAEGVSTDANMPQYLIEVALCYVKQCNLFIRR